MSKSLISVQLRGSKPDQLEDWQKEVDEYLNDKAYTFVNVTHEVTTSKSGAVISLPVAWFIHDAAGRNPYEKGPYGS